MAQRKWLQFQLATSVVLVLVAGGLMGANFIAHPVPEMYGDAYGFPLPMYQNWKNLEYEKAMTSPLVKFTVVKYITVAGHEFYFNSNGWSYTLLAIDFFSWLMMLVMVGFCMEKFMRSRQRQV